MLTDSDKNYIEGFFDGYKSKENELREKSKNPGVQFLVYFQNKYGKWKKKDFEKWLTK